MSKDNRDESFNLLAHEKEISDLYQNSNKQLVEEPSVQIDTHIMAIANQQLLDNPSLLAKKPVLEQPVAGNQSTAPKAKKAWQWPASLVASVGILGVLFITQNKYFIHPTNIIAEDAGVVNAPVMRAPDMSTVEPETEEILAKQSFEQMQTTASTQKVETRLDKEFAAAAGKKVPISQTQKGLKEHILNRSMLEDNSAITAPMSLSDMSKLAELLKLELAIQKNSERDTSTSSIKMQQTLFEHLSQYQKNHAEFKLTENYLSVLTEKQVKQLNAFDTEAVPEN